MLPALIPALAPILSSVVSRVLPEDPEKARQLENELKVEMMNRSSELAQAQASIVRAEAEGESWLQRSWRPIMMLWFGGLVGAYWFGFTPPNLNEEAITGLFTLVQIGIGGYVVGRSGEKIARNLKDVMRK